MCIMIALVGYTGFVGSNIYAAADGEIEALYNSKNIEEAYGTNPELLIYSGLRAEKFLANNAPQKDKEAIIHAENNIKKINPQKLVLISTIDVFKRPVEVNENSKIDTRNLHAYGYNRYQFEFWVRENYPDALIIRLPGLFGSNIRKNFIYDYINIIPFMLNEHKMEELSAIDPELKEFYKIQDNGFYKSNILSADEKIVLKNKCKKIGFTALNFTDSRSKYQFYNLARLWEDIQIAVRNNLKLWHPATEPVSAGELYEFLTGQQFENVLDGVPANYDYRTVYEEIFNGKNGYICTKDVILEEIRKFVDQEQL